MRREFALPEERPQIIMTEEVSTPIERTWTARFEPLYLAQWWRPGGYVNPIVELDLVPGGRWRISQRDPEGNEFVSRPSGTTIITTHETESMAWRRGYLRLGALERMSESSDRYGLLLSQIKPR